LSPPVSRHPLMPDGAGSTFSRPEAHQGPVKLLPVSARENTPMKVDFTLNGKSTTVDVPPDMPLLWVLRDVLDLKGTKFGCGVAQCGACTVHVNGEPARSCTVAAPSIQGARVTTIEGLSPNGSHPLQRAWEELDVPQCGYCQAGQLMSAAALLARTPRPTDAEIDAAMSENLCRCATYLRIRAGIHRAAAIASGTSPAGPRRGTGGSAAPKRSG